MENNINVQLDESGYFTGNWCKTGNLLNAKEINVIPEMNDLNKAKCYKYDSEKKQLILDEDKYHRFINENKMNQLTALKIDKLNCIGTICTQTITNGIDVMGLGHFSLTEKDQLNITSLYNEVIQGASTVLYHADGKLCKLYTAQEMTLIAITAKKFVTYHTTLCNHLNVWIRRCTTTEELQNITYTAPLPEDLQESLNSIVDTPVENAV